jgi:hypothetical protein
VAKKWKFAIFCHFFSSSQEGKERRAGERGKVKEGRERWKVKGKGKGERRNGRGGRGEGKGREGKEN